MASPLERVRRTIPSRLLAAAYVVILLGAVCIGLWVVGDISNESYDSPDGGSMLGLRLPAPLYGDGPGTVVAGIFGTALVVLSVILSALATRDSRRRAAWMWVSLAWSGLIGFAAGAALRVVFALTWDANIGGGLLLMFGLPILAFAWVVGLVPLSFAHRGGGGSTGSPAASSGAGSRVLTIVLWALAVGTVMALPFNVSTLADGIYWTVCSDPQCGDAASLSQIVFGGVGIAVAVVAVTGAALWHVHTRRPRSGPVTGPTSA